MNWNNTQFGARDPITLRAARRIGNILKCITGDAGDERIAARYSFCMWTAASFSLPRLLHHRLKLFRRDLGVTEAGRLLGGAALEFGPERGAAVVAGAFCSGNASLASSCCLGGRGADPPIAYSALRRRSLTQSVANATLSCSVAGLRQSASFNTGASTSYPAP